MSQAEGQSGQASGETGSVSRRGVLGAAAGLGVVAPLLAACGSGDSGGDSGGDSDATGTGAPSGPVATTSDIPVGGGLIVAAEKVVVTQPTEGEYKAFTAVCTHQSCVVTEIKGEEIACPCHGSSFSIKDGSVVNGPAKEPLNEFTVSVDGENISIS